MGSTSSLPWIGEVSLRPLGMGSLPPAAQMGITLQILMIFADGLLYTCTILHQQLHQHSRSEARPKQYKLLDCFRLMFALRVSDLLPPYICWNKILTLSSQIASSIQTDPDKSSKPLQKCDRYQCYSHCHHASSIHLRDSWLTIFNYCCHSHLILITLVIIVLLCKNLYLSPISIYYLIIAIVLTINDAITITIIITTSSFISLRGFPCDKDLRLFCFASLRR